MLSCYIQVLTEDIWQNLEGMIYGKVVETGPIITRWNPKVLQVESKKLFPLWTDEIAPQAIVYGDDYQAKNYREHKTESKHFMINRGFVFIHN